MSVKVCKRCQREFPLADFYHHKMMADGHLNFCKGCVRKQVAGHRENNLEKIQEYDRKRGRTEERKERNSAYARANKEKVARHKEEWVQRNREKRKAQIRACNALRDGKLERKACEVCGAVDRVQMHHEDYSKPLEVMWLCTKHHGERHRKYD